LASLGRAFNQMAEELAQAREAERLFLLSVSHELKTPLALIRGHGEALLDGVIAVPKAAGHRGGGGQAARTSGAGSPRSSHA